MTFWLGRGRSERGFGHNIGPHRLDHRFEDRDGDTAAGPASAERPALVVRVVVADPDRDRNVVGETDEPDVILCRSCPRHTAKGSQSTLPCRAPGRLGAWF